MRDIFIGKGTVAYGAGTTLATGGAWTIDTLTTGAIVFLKENGSIVDGTTPVAESDVAGAYITVQQKTPNGINKGSVPLYRKGFTYTKQLYVAPVATVKFLGSDDTLGSLNLPSSLTVGATVGLTIIDKSKNSWDTSATHSYSFNVVSGDSLTGLVSPNIIVKLIAKINADPNRIVDALIVDDTTNATGIKLTARTAGKDFTVAQISGVLQNATVVEYKRIDNEYNASSTTAVVNVPGNGTSAQVLALEKEIRTHDGYNPVIANKGLMWDTDYMTVSGATYTIYTLHSVAPQDSIARDANYPVEVVLAVASGDSALIAILDEVLALVGN